MHFAQQTGAFEVIDSQVSDHKMVMPYVNNKDADQPACPRSLITIFVVHSKKV